MSVFGGKVQYRTGTDLPAPFSRCRFRSYCARRRIRFFVRTRLRALDIPASNFEIDSRVFYRVPLREPSIPLERALWHE